MKKSIIIALLIVSGCAVGPKFRAPKAVLPETYTYSMDTAAIGDLSHWWTNFGDPVLDTLVEQAFKGNKNLASAVKNIETARLKISSARAAAGPSIGLSAGADVSYNSETKITQEYSVTPTISWDIDIWGKIRRQTEAAGASYRATEYEVRAIAQTLAADVATTYFTAQSYQEALRIAENTFASRQRSQVLMDSMYKYGYISEVDLSQSRASMSQAGATVEQYRRALEQSVLALNLLLGENPRPIEIGEIKNITLAIPTGIPSALLERRPDVMQAYYGVKEANAMIGVAVANRLPSLSLTGDGGFVKTIVDGTSSGKPVAWSGAAQLIAPILNWGTLRRNEKIARIQTEQAVINYEQSMLNAINEVEKTLVAIDTYGRELAQSEVVVNSSKVAGNLTKELYRSGSSSYLDVLDADRTLFSAQLQYVQTINNRLSSYITLYKALGGGW